MNTPPGVQTDWTACPGPQAYIEWVDQSGTTNWIDFSIVESETWTEGAEVTEHPVEVGANIGDHVRVKLAKCELKIFSSNEPIDQSPLVGTARFTALTTPTPLSVPTPAWTPGPGVVTVPEWNNNIELRALAGSLVGLAGGVGGTGGAIAGLAVTALADVLLPGYKTSLPVPTNAGLQPPQPRYQHAVVQTFPGEDFVLAVHQKLLELKNNAQIIKVIGTKQENPTMVIESLSFMRDMDTGTGESLTIGFKEIRQVATQTVTVPTPNLSAGGGVPPVSHGGQDPVPLPPAAVVSALKTLKTNRGATP